jgi:hypothetical protein
MPQDKERLADVLRKFIGMPPEQQVLFQVGKRAGYFLSLDDMNISGRLEQVKEICRESVITTENADDRIHEIVQERMKRGMPF